ncbi:MAG: hypothetical protein ACUVUS_04020 [Thermoproteota archaeon]
MIDTRLSEYEERAKRIVLYVALISIALIAAILIFLLVPRFLHPPSASVDFELTLNLTQVEVFQGDALHVLVTLVPEGSFQQDVYLEIRDRPSNMSIDASRWILNPSFMTSVLTINTYNVSPGVYNVIIVGRFREIERGASLTISLKEVEKPWFEVIARAQPERIMQTEAFFLNLSIIPHAGFNDSISVLIDGLPGSSFEPKTIGKGNTSLRINIYTSRSTPIGINNFTKLSSTNYRTILNLTIEVYEAPPPSFQIYFTPNITIAKPSDTVNIFVSVKPFYGFDEVVYVYSSYIGLSLMSFNGSDFVLMPNNYSGVMMSMETDRVLDYGIYDLTFVVETSSTKDFKLVRLGIANVSYSFKKPIPGILVYPTKVEVSPGREVTFNVLIESINGFEGEVIPMVTSPPIGKFYFSTGEGFPKIGVSIERVNITIGEARFLFLSAMIYSDVVSDIHRANVELCVEYTPPNMAFPLLNAMSVYAIEFHIR